MIVRGAGGSLACHCAKNEQVSRLFYELFTDSIVMPPRLFPCNPCPKSSIVLKIGHGLHGRRGDLLRKSTNRDSSLRLRHNYPSRPPISFLSNGVRTKIKVPALNEVTTNKKKKSA